jgi:hypothetical protein
MPKFMVTTINGGSYEVEADTYQDAGHEGRWIDFRTQMKGNWVPVLRVRSQDVRKVDLKD